MNNEWVKYSDRSSEDIVVVTDHEDWLDYLNLYETSWILFVWTRSNWTGSNSEDGNFGWPSKKHE